MIRPIGGKRLPDTSGTMKDSDPPDDLEQTILETFDEMHAEAQIAPIVLTFPAEVMRIEPYTKEHSLEPATLIPLAIKAQEHQLDIFFEAVERLMQDPDSFARPLQDPNKREE
jgi:hypothetical protein